MPNALGRTMIEAFSDNMDFIGGPPLVVEARIQVLPSLHGGSLRPLRCLVSCMCDRRRIDEGRYHESV
jgi:hypothetical protein